MRDYISIGPAPSNEECAPVGAENYQARARAECNRFIEVIRGVLGEEPGGAGLGIKSNPHDFGSYLEVVCSFDDEDEEATRYASRCEDKAPTEWGALPEPGRSPPNYLGLPIFSGSIRNQNDNPGPCDFCGAAAVVDARTKTGPWANLCETDFQEHGVGLGTGYGQKFANVDPPEKPAQGRPTTVCESCREAAIEEGAPEDGEGIALVLSEMGGDIADHFCDEDENGGCLCACRRRR